MADRIHPTAESSPASGNTSKPPEIPSFLPKPQPSAGTYVVQVPKDQIYRVPPPENARKFQKYRSRRNRRSGCCCCLCWITSLIFLLIFLTAITAGVMYLVLRPKIPKYSVDSLSIKGFNLTSSLSFSPEFDVTIRAENPNKKIGIDYRKGSSVTVSSSDVELCNGVLPVFYQGTKNITVFQTVLTSSGVQLSNAIHETLLAEQRNGSVPLVLHLKVPVRVKVGVVKSWTVTVKVRCLLNVDKLTEDSRLLSKECKVVDVNL